ncbi:ABC transporter permease [Sinosporangium siamense]|uniref:ABC transporter permease n=1 Tax=Sinosporangium siamense TaxID=1367973 RepID=UPI0019526B10|nr:ABC transporter permease [Sinosporangium siamense]
MATVTVTTTALFSAGPQLPERLAGAGVLVGVHERERPEGNFTPDRPWAPERVEALVGALRKVPGVKEALPDRAFYAQVVKEGKPLEEDRGYAWSTAGLAPYSLVSGVAPRNAGEVALGREAGVAVGARVEVLTARGPSSYTVTGTIDGPGVYLSDREALPMAEGVRTIGLVLNPGADAEAVAGKVRSVIGKQDRVFAGDARVELEPLADARIRWMGMQILTAMSALAAFAAVFVVSSTFAFGVAQRRHEFGLLRVVGATPRQVRGMVYGEALAVGCLSALSGVVVGALVAPAFGQVLVNLGIEPRGFEVQLHPLPIAGAFAVGVLVALVGVWSASRRAARVAPIEALREASVDERPMPRLRWITGGLLCLSGTAGVVLTSSAGGDELVVYALYTAMALILGMALLAPLIVPPVLWAVTWPLTRMRGATGILVRESAMVSVRRTAATAAPVLVTVGFAVLITGMVQTTAGAISAARVSTVQAQAVMVPDGTPGLSDAALRGSGAMSLLFTGVYAPSGETLPVYGVDDELLAHEKDKLEVVSGSLADFGGTAVAVDTVAAELQGWRLGQTVPVVFEDGRTVPLTVIAVLKDAPAHVLISRETVRAHDPVVLADQGYIVRGTPAAGPVAGLGARIVSAADLTQESQDEEDRLVWIYTLLLAGVTVGYTGVAIANTQMMAAVSRRRDLLVLRLSGALKGQVLRTVAIEAVFVVLLGTLLGVAVALPALLGMRAGLSEELNAHVPLVVPMPVVLGAIVTCLVVSAAAAAVAAGRAIRDEVKAD